MECEYCNHVLSTLSSLKLHQKTAKYCLAKQNKISEEYPCSFCNTSFTLKSSLHKHLRICKSNNPVIQEQLELLDEKSCELEQIKNKLSVKDRLIKKNRFEFEKMISDKDKKLSERDLLISEQKIIIKELQEQYKSHIEMQNKDLQNRIQSMAEKAIDKPSSSTVNINNLLPITNEHLEDQVQFLTKEHVSHGAVGYAKYALEYPLKDRLVCTDTSRKKGKYKDVDGNLVSDPEMSSITKKLFLAIKDRNDELVNEYACDLKSKLDKYNSSANNDMNDEESVVFSGITDELIDLITSAFSQKRQSCEITQGLKPELFNRFVKELATGSYRSK